MYEFIIYYKDGSTLHKVFDTYEEYYATVEAHITSQMEIPDISIRGGSWGPIPQPDPRP